MYLHKLRIQRLRRIRDLVLELPIVDGCPRRWTVLIGENGTAKTSILQAIAMAAAGRSQVNAVVGRGVDLMRDRRTEGDAMRVCAEFVFTPRSLARRELHPMLSSASVGVPAGLRSELWLDANSTTVRGKADYIDHEGNDVASSEDPLDHARAVHSALWFVAAYGVARVLPESSFTPDLTRRSVERLRSVFDHRVQLASIGFANHFLKRDVELGERVGTRSRLFARVLNDIIQAGGDELMPGVCGLELRGQGGARSAARLIESDRFRVQMGKGQVTIAGVSLSHGFQSTFAWIADLVGHILLEADESLRPADMEGLVLIDEIDLYLHPKWQSSFVRALQRVFPRLQFIATTHSPVVLAGLRANEIVRLGVDSESGDVQQLVRDARGGDLVPLQEGGVDLAAEPDPRSMTGTEVYDEYFGIHRLTLHPEGERIRRFLALSSDPLRSKEQDAEVRKLKRELERAGIGSLPRIVRRAQGT